MFSLWNLPFNFFFIILFLLCTFLNMNMAMQVFSPELTKSVTKREKLK